MGFQERISEYESDRAMAFKNIMDRFDSPRRQRREMLKWLEANDEKVWEICAEAPPEYAQMYNRVLKRALMTR